MRWLQLLVNGAVPSLAEPAAVAVLVAASTALVLLHPLVHHKSTNSPVLLREGAADESGGALWLLGGR